MASDDLIKKLKAALGDAGVLTGKDAEEKAVGGWSKLGIPAAVLRPASAAEVSAAASLDCVRCRDGEELSDDCACPQRCADSVVWRTLLRRRHQAETRDSDQFAMAAQELRSADG